MTSFGKYQVVELIGQGGFGRVYKAFDPALKRHVAVKTCLLQDGEMRARFGREAEIAANLRHPHIVTVYDYGHEGDEPYLVQEYLEGEDLDHKLKRGDAIDPQQLLEWLRQTAEGLEYAHTHGVLHRDIKPANIRVLPAGDVRIMDFGIAKLLEEDRQLTRTGMSVGTPSYLAPEQLMGLRVDHRADIFSFGAMAYELVSGKKPFEADSFTAILFRVAHEEPAALELIAPACDRRLVALISRCLRKTPDERFADCGELVRELRSLAGAPPAWPTPPAARTTVADGAATVLYGAASAPRSEVHPSTPAAGETAPAPRRRRISPAVWGLAAATLLVAGFGVLNVSQLGTGTPAGSELNMPLGAGAGAQAGSTEDIAGTTPVDPLPRGGVASAAVAAAASAAGTPVAGEAAAPPVEGGREQPATALSAGRVVVLVAGTTRDIADAAETTIIAELQEAGFDVRDAELISGTDASRTAAAQMSGLIGIGRAAGAATVIIVDVTADARSIVAGMYSGTAAVTIKLYGTAGGELLSSERFEIGTAQSRAEPGPTALAAATTAVRAASFQAGRSAVRRLETPRR
jgi:eukaryotic-like serine/threonine-protein kinase